MGNTCKKLKKYIIPQININKEINSAIAILSTIKYNTYKTYADQESQCFKDIEKAKNEGLNEGKIETLIVMYKQIRFDLSKLDNMNLDFSKFKSEYIEKLWERVKKKD